MSTLQINKAKSLKLAKFNFAIPLMATAGLATLGITAINQDIDETASASNTMAVNSTISYAEQFITISNSKAIDLSSDTVTAAGSRVYATDNVTVTTNVPTGYDLYITSGDSSSAALKTSESYTEVAATSGTGGSGGTPKALDADSYGYAVASSVIGNNGFDADYSTLTNDSKFAGVPAGTQDRLRSTNSAVESGETTSVYYGAHLTNYLAPGQYTGNVIYSAVATPTDNTITATISPTSGIYKSNLTVTSGPKDTISTAHNLQGDDIDIIFSQNGEAKGHCNVSSSDTSAGYLVTSCQAPNLAAGTYDVEIVVPRYGFKDKITSGYTSKEYVSDSLDYDFIMQGMPSSTCSSLREYVAADPIGTTYTGLDSRDLSTYSIRRLKDGHCWMVQNLRLANKTISSADSDLTSGSFTIPASSTSGFSSYNTANVYVNTSNNNYGGYYTWYAATAGVSTDSVSSGDVSTSICPKGWKLPKGDTADYSWYYLGQKYGFTGSTSDATLSTNFQGATNTGSGYWAGYYSSGSLSNAGSYGYWWSRTALDSSHAYDLRTGNSYVNLQSNDTKYRGYSVRRVFVGS